jgi:hypothetical protein
MNTFYITCYGKGESMTISELINNWTEEERKQHANLIMECLQREQLINDLEARTGACGEDLAKNWEHLSSGLSRLWRNVNRTSGQMENIYLRWTNPQANA